MIFITENAPKINEGNHTNKRKSSLTSLVACNLGKVYCKPELTEEDMPVV